MIAVRQTQRILLFQNDLINLLLENFHFQRFRDHNGDDHGQKQTRCRLHDRNALVTGSFFRGLDLAHDDTAVRLLVNILGCTSFREYSATLQGREDKSIQVEDHQTPDQSKTDGGYLAFKNGEKGITRRDGGHDSSEEHNRTYTSVFVLFGVGTISKDIGICSRAEMQEGHHDL